MPSPDIISEARYQSSLQKMTCAVIERVHLLLRKKQWSQGDLARALHKSPSEISKYLSGEHNLTLKTITKLEAALGQPLLVVPESPPDLIDQSTLIRQLSDYFAGQDISEAYLFGSVARGDHSAESDVDILVSFPPDATVTLFDLARMRNELIDLTGRKVDLVVAGSEHEQVRADSEGDKIKVYGKA